MNNRFALDTRLQNDTDFVIDLQLCTVRLMDDAQYPWLILVPQVADVSELHHLTETQQSLLNLDSNLTSVVLTEVFNPETLNIAALGNIVRQLHVHHVARYSDDPAWPGPIWGKQPAIQYDSKVKLKLINTLQQAFAKLA